MRVNVRTTTTTTTTTTTGGPVNKSKPFHFLGIPEESIFQVRHGKSLKILFWWMWDLNPRPEKPMVLPTTPFVEVLVGY